MNILLTGGAGYIGSHTAVELLEAGYDVIIADNLYNSDEKVIGRIGKITGKTPKFYNVDVCDREKFSKVFTDQKIDAVVHFAGYKAVGESVQKPLMYYRNNLEATMTVVELMQEYSVRDIVFSSSATVYEAGHSRKLVEGMPRACTNPYGWTKFMSEQILMDAQHANPALRVALLRYFNPIGAHKSGLIGEDPVGIPNNLMPYISRVAIGKLPKLGVFGNDYDTKDGTGVRDYIHVVDLARGHVKALEYLSKHEGVLTTNLGTGRGYSVLEVVHAFERANNVKIPYEIQPRRAGDVAENYAATDYARETIGFVAEYDIEDMCRDSWNWQSKNPDGYRTQE